MTFHFQSTLLDERFNNIVFMFRMGLFLFLFLGVIFGLYPSEAFHSIVGIQVVLSVPGIVRRVGE